ncbi:hypothetical protein CYMTET_31092 [Cymbomonas tetramitiformis]|uniref:Uncharacterized protein n=1 Tax=Cymbomonas tetramitiformis TaxID=36881 RepID=A0AAE0FHQ3_9CHLO|nr:hypothetical protein CYMTET_31092 [Cymbomonas tetramitiformis]
MALAVMQSAETYNKPFASSTYFCQIFPLHFYLDLIQSWPIDRVFTNYASKKNSCSASGCRYYMTSTNIFKGTGGMAKKWDGYLAKKSIWQALSDAVFNPNFEAALFQKLGVTKKVKSREMRILSDKKGQSSGRVHTDMDARKVATMMLYTPPDHDSAQMWDYGTCLHTQDQFNKRKLIKESQGARKGPRGSKDGESQCFYKFRYLPNSGYAFKVHDSSWHSAPNSRIRHWKGTARNSILLNWYSKN